MNTRLPMIHVSRHVEAYEIARIEFLEPVAGYPHVEPMYLVYLAHDTYRYQPMVATARDLAPYMDLDAWRRA